MNLHDSEPGDCDERRKIISIVWGNRKGWFVCTKLGDDSGDVTDVDANQSYAINVELHKLTLTVNQVSLATITIAVATAQIAH